MRCPRLAARATPNAHQLPLVAKANQSKLINRKPYHSQPGRRGRTSYSECVSSRRGRPFREMLPTLNSWQMPFAKIPIDGEGPFRSRPEFPSKGQLLIMSASWIQCPLSGPIWPGVRLGSFASPPRFLRHVRSSPICSEETLCLLKTPKGQESLEMFAPPPYRREHDHNSFYPAVNNRATKQRVTFSHQFCSIASPIRISSDQLRARRG
jgi:hypothetical protein